MNVSLRLLELFWCKTLFVQAAHLAISDKLSVHLSDFRSIHIQELRFFLQCGPISIRLSTETNDTSRYQCTLPTLEAFVIAQTRPPGMTETSYHTISIYEKLLVIQFHTIPYVQKFVWNLYDKYFSIYENCMIGVFPKTKKFEFLFLNLFS